jgi:uncharacterized protein
MNLMETINQDIKKAMLAKEKEKLEALRAIKSAILVQQTEKGASHELTPDLEIKILQRLVKQRKESAEVYAQQSREDLAQPEIFQAQIIQAYLPEQLSDDQVRQKIKAIVSETGAQGMKDMGKVMGRASKELAGKADNKLISSIVKELLS